VTSTAACSDIALYYIGRPSSSMARAINAFTNASTNSYKRLVPGFEAPVKLAYSARKSLRLHPYSLDFQNPKGPAHRKCDFPTPTGNPYFMFASMLLAGLDGIQNKIHPGDPADKGSVWTWSRRKTGKFQRFATRSIWRSITWTRIVGFLKAGGVFTDDLIDGLHRIEDEGSDSIEDDHASDRN